ncbi:NCS1 family nucleobase:cation symporter-1 [Actinomyces lilanjuaniae]|uniref:NCS1 family nucleobase:cation symporter-1 n=1 Tax=Actinomyces lilanjuaniae TaxID=2321394 RepID=A0ABM6Z5I7_9ACTO|nr:NCS1 family nucleobase:cation symporter-1 [Actinomyces lilanjuaniae]AYD90654.1 NCS1 family nucleobase:cation symporter-1 [Actinomyces lilanjuaniae]
MEAVEVDRDELRRGDTDGRLFNDDLAPATAQERTWGGYALFSLWMNDAHNASNYTFAAALFIGTGTLTGMTPLGIVIGVLLATLIIFVACCVSGLMGYETGAPYPVISRVTWGVWGANFPAVIRGIVAIAWYGIQTYLASVSLELLMIRVLPLVGELDAPVLGLRVSGWVAFLVLSAVQLVIVWRGMDAVRHFQGLAGPVIWVIMIGLGAWMLWQAGWEFDWTANAEGRTPGIGYQVYQVMVAVGLTVGTLATLMLNFSDFARYAPSARSMVLGNVLGLPLNWTAFAMTSVLCSAAAIKVYGEAFHDPGDLLSRIDNDLVFYVVSLGFIVATIGVNIVANFVSAAFDLSNVSPRRLSFRVGGIVAVLASIAVTPWNLYGSPVAITYFLGSLGALLGPFFGILVIDYFYYKRSRVDLHDLYSPARNGRYYYQRGVNLNALAAFVPAAVAALCIALLPLRLCQVLAPFSWFIAAPLGALCYWVVMTVRGQAPGPDVGTDSGPGAETGPAPASQPVG